MCDGEGSNLRPRMPVSFWEYVLKGNLDLEKFLKISEPWPFQAHATSEPWALGRLRCYKPMARDLDFNLGQEKFFRI